jgi:hypothetical protein
MTLSIDLDSVLKSAHQIHGQGHCYFVSTPDLGSGAYLQEYFQLRQQWCLQA